MFIELMLPLYGFGVREAIAEFPLPLKPEDAEVVVNLPAVFEQVYALGSYEVLINYNQSVPPPGLSSIEQQWLDELLIPL